VQAADAAPVIPGSRRFAQREVVDVEQDPRSCARGAGTQSVAKALLGPEVMVKLSDRSAILAGQRVIRSVAVVIALTSM